jgi:hypothetical protein
MLSIEIINLSRPKPTPTVYDDDFGPPRLNQALSGNHFMLLAYNRNDRHHLMHDISRTGS